jgi:phenylalanyl-tRNA synthetase alpha chain
MTNEMQHIKSELDAILGKINDADTTKLLEEIRILYLGKSGILTSIMHSMSNLDPEAKRTLGKDLNNLKQAITQAIETRKCHLEERQLNKQLESEWIDLSLPPKQYTTGTIHPISRAISEITEIFVTLGFKIADGPEIEEEFFNFDALNIPANHPARQMHDTFYMPDSMLLRTHTSNVEIRHMKENKPPYRIIAPGRVYRHDFDATHAPMFHQIEGLCIDTKLTMAHLKWTIIEFLKAFFEKDTIPVRFRPSYFPFTEPSAEVDIACKRTKNDLIIGETDSWLEVMGCGMTHPNVLTNVGLDSNIYQGFAFGMGVERLAMLKYGISDLRDFFSSDIRWLKHYGTNPYSIASITGGLSE